MTEVNSVSQKDNSALYTTGAAAIGAAILGIGTYLIMNSKKEPAEMPQKVDAKV